MRYFPLKWRNYFAVAIILISTHIFSLTLKAQDSTISFSQSELNKIFNKAFSSLVTSNGSTGAIANYASFDPVAGSFTFKGTTPIGVSNNSKEGKISYLSISVTGDLINSSYGALFSNFSLNTSVSIQAQYNFRTSKVHYALSQGGMAQYNLKRELLRVDYEATFRSIGQGLRGADSLLIQLRQQQASKYADSLSQAKVYTNARYYADSLYAILRLGDTSFMARFKKATDSLAAARKSLDDIGEEIVKNTRKQDSLTLIIRQKTHMRNYLEGAAFIEYQTGLDSLLLKAPLKPISIKWFSIAGGIGKQHYNTYDPSRVFSAQIKPNNQTTGNASVAWNYYHTDYFKKHITFLQAGASWSRDNNTALLSTAEVDDTKKISNSGGDTTRSITKKYNAFTDSVVKLNAFGFFGHFFYIFGQRPGGIHIFPDISFRSDKLTIFNAGLGYIISFLNSKKGDPVVNAEAYFKFKDITNQQKEKTGFWNRNEIGISFTLPFNFMGN